MKTRVHYSRFLLVIFFCISLVPAFACLDLPEHPPEVEIIPCYGPNNEMKVILKNYDTYGASVGEYCACALNIPVTFGTVTSASIVHSGTFTPVNGWSFMPDPDTQFPTPANWQGFSSAVSTSIGVGIPVDIVFCVTPFCEHGDGGQGQNCDCGEEVSELLNILTNNPPAIGTGGADANGVPDHHLSEMPLGNITMGNLIFVDEYNDGIPDNYSPINGSVLEETDGTLIVSPASPGASCGVAIENPTQKSDFNSCNPDVAWYFNIDTAPSADNSELREIMIEAVGVDGGILERVIYDYQNQLIYNVTRNPITGQEEAELVGAMEDGTGNRAERKRSYSWWPPTCKGPRCDYGFQVELGNPPDIIFVARWRIGKLSAQISGDKIESLSHLNVTANSDFYVFRSEFRADTAVPTDLEDTWSIAPTQYNTTGGETGSLMGEGFLSAGVLQISIDGTVVPHSVVSDTQIDFITPPGILGDATLTYLTSRQEVKLKMNFYNMAPFEINTSTPPLVGQLGQPMSYLFQATGLAGANFGLAYGQLPAGLMLNSSGLLSGTPTEAGVFPLFIAAQDDLGNRDIKIFFLEVQQGFLDLAVKVFLQGSLDMADQLMNNNLSTNSLLPLQDPYGFNQFITNANLLNGAGSDIDAIVDWVLVELRKVDSPTVAAESVVALLRRDGNIVDLDGASSLQFCGLPTGEYHVVVKHRNHLGVMSNKLVTVE